MMELDHTPVHRQMVIHATGDRHIYVSTDGDSDDGVFLPLAHICVNVILGAVAEITMPKWLADERGLE